MDICSTMFIAALFVIARTWKHPKCPSTEEWIEKMWYIYTMEYYSAEKKQWNLEICRQIDGTRRNHSERSNPITKRQTWYVLTHMRILGIEWKITSLQSTLPKKLINKEDPKWDIHGPLEKRRGSRNAEKSGSMGRCGRELGEWEGEKRRDAKDMREQKVWVRGRIEGNKNGDIIEADILGLQRNQALGKCLEIYKDDTR